MAFALNVSSPKKQIYTSRLNKYAYFYLFTIFISMVLPLLWILKIILIENISFIPFFMGSKKLQNHSFYRVGKFDKYPLYFYGEL